MAISKTKPLRIGVIAIGLIAAIAVVKWQFFPDKVPNNFITATAVMGDPRVFSVRSAVSICSNRLKKFIVNPARWRERSAQDWVRSFASR